MHKKDNNRAIKRGLLLLWILIITAGMLFYLCNRELFTQQRIILFLQQYQSQIWLAYFLLCVVRGLFLLPATPFLLAGIWLFRDSLLIFYPVFMLSIFTVSAFLYYSSRFMSWQQLSDRLNASRLIQERLRGKSVFWFILGWAFIPVTPTDLVCYAAGVLRIRFWTFMLPLLLGEAIICGCYVFGGFLLNT